MIKLIKDILTAIQTQDKTINPAETNEYIDLVSFIVDFFSKFINDNSKNREYFILKGGVSLCSKFIDRSFPIFYNNSKLVVACCNVLGNTAQSNDNKILLWVLGTIPNLINVVKDCIKQEILPIERAEHALYALWKATIDCEDVQEELMKQKFMDTALDIIQNHSQHTGLISFAMAIIRRLATNSKYKTQIGN